MLFCGDGGVRGMSRSLNSPQKRVTPHVDVYTKAKQMVRLKHFCDAPVRDERV